MESQAPQSSSPSAPPAGAPRSHSCAWCGAPVQAADLSCPSCGAEVDLASLVSKSGWVKLPGRKDMAKLQFGNSYCQIEGTFVPVADVAEYHRAYRSGDVANTEGRQ